MRRLCRDSSCSYLGRSDVSGSVPLAGSDSSAGWGNPLGDGAEVSRGHSTRNRQEAGDGEGLNIRQRVRHCCLMRNIGCDKRRSVP